MAARCPVCEHIIDNRTIWGGWNGVAGNHRLDCPRCGETLRLTQRSGVLIALVAGASSLAMLALLLALRAEGFGMIWIALPICVAIFLLTVFVYLALGRYEKAESLSINVSSTS